MQRVDISGFHGSPHLPARIAPLQGAAGIGESVRAGLQFVDVLAVTY
jgi:hypothetical protein